MTMPGGGGSRNANVTVSADTGAYVKGINAANSATLAFANTLKKIDDQVLSITKKVGVGAMAVGTGGLFAAFGDVKTANQVEQSFKNLSAQATVTGAKVGDISNTIVKLGTQVPISTSNLAALTTQISALGIQGTKNLQQLTLQASQLAAATNTAPGQLMTGLIQMNQSMGGSISDLQRYGSVLTTVQAKMGVAATDVMSFVGGIQAVGQKAGVTENQMIALSAAFVKVGADGATGAQAFNQVVNQMSDAVARNSDQVGVFARVLGVTQDQFKKMIQSGNAYQAFIGFINGINSQGAQAGITLQNLGLDSVRLQRVFAELTSGQANLGGAMTTVNQAFDQNSSMATAAAAAWSGLSEQMQRLANVGTQVKNELGAPLLQIFTPLSSALADVGAGLANVFHAVNAAPWPIGDTLTSLVTKTPALLLLGGAFITLTAAISKFAGVWRGMTGVLGGTAIKGFMDSRAGRMPAEMGDQSRTQSFLYRMGYGANTRGSGMVGANKTQGIGGFVARYPMMRARQQLGQAWDTMKHPLDYTKRDPSKTDPYSMLGMSQAAQRGAVRARASLSDRLRNADGQGDSTPGWRTHLADSLDRGFGPVGNSAEAVRRNRFNYVSTAYMSGLARQRGINSSLGRSDSIDLLRATELAQHRATGADDSELNPTQFHKWSNRRLKGELNDGQAVWVAQQTAKKAEQEWDSKASDEDTAKLANPFKKLADKIKTISSEMLTETEGVIKGVMDAVVGFYDQATQKIVALTSQAKASFAELRAFAADGTVRQSGMPVVPPNVLSLYGMKPPVGPVPRYDGKDIVTRATSEGPAADLVRKMAYLPIVPTGKGGPTPVGPLSVVQPKDRPQFAGTAGETRVTPTGPAYDEVNVLANRPGVPTRRITERPPVPGTLPDTEVQAERSMGRFATMLDRLSARFGARSVPGVAPIAATEAAAAEDVNAGVQNVITRRPPVPLSPTQAALETHVLTNGESVELRSPHDLAAETARGFDPTTVGHNGGIIMMSPRLGSPEPGDGATGTAGLPRGWRLGGVPATERPDLDQSNWISQKTRGAWNAGKGFMQETAMPAVAEGAKSAASGLKNIGGAIGTMMSTVFSPQLLIAGTLLAPVVTNLVTAFVDAHRKLSTDMDYAGAAIQRALGQQVTTQADLIKQQQGSGSPGDVAQGAWGDNEINDSKSGKFADSYKRQISGLQALGAGSEHPSGAQVDAQQTYLQSYLNGMVQAQNQGKPATADQMKQMREMALAAVGQNPQQAQDLVNNLDVTGRRTADWVGKLGGAYAKNGDDTLRASLSTTALQDYDTNTGGGIAGILAAAGTVQQQTGGVKVTPGFAPRGGRPGPDRVEAKSSNVGDLLNQFINDHNAADPNSKFSGPTFSGNGSVGEWLKSIAAGAKMGNSGDVTAENQIQGLHLQLDKHGELTQATIDRLTKMADNNTSTNGIDKPMGNELDGTALNNAYRKVTGDSKGYITSLLQKPDDQNYSQTVGKIMSELSGGATAFSSNAVPAFQSVAKAIQDVKDRLGTGPGDPAWGQLDKLAQMNFSNLTQAAQLGGGQAFQLSAQTQLVGTMAAGGVTGSNYNDIKAQNDQLAQESAQAVQTLDQYYVQVRDYHLQTQRAQQDHDTQMSRMQRDYNKQVNESNYQYGKQQDEALYNDNLRKAQAQYQFNEQIRSMKYSTAEAFGNPGTTVQAQYTQGLGSQILGIQQQTKDLQASKNAVDQMQKMGVSTDAIRVFKLDDPKNFSQAQKDLKDFISNPQLIDTFNKTVADQLNIAEAISSDPNNSQFADMKRQFDYTAQQASDAFTHAADVSATAFAHSMDLNKKQMEQSTSDFEADFKKSQSRAAYDLSLLGEDTTKSWSDLISWAQKSGLPWVKALGDTASVGIGQVNDAAGKLNATIAGLPKSLTDNLPALQAALGTIGNMIGGAFGGIRGIFGGISTGGGGDNSGLNGVAINYSGGANGVRQGAVVGAAESWLGTPYDWGGEGLNGQGVDCSGLVIAAYRAAGIPFAGRPVASTLGKMGKAVSQAQALPGDVVYYDEPGPIDHVGIYLGSGKMIDSPTQGEKVRVDNIGTPTSIRRMYATGGVFDARSDITVGEAGPEIVLPLNAHGAQFMAQTMRASFSMMDPKLANEVRRGRVAQGVPTQAASNMSYHHTDASTNFNGAITVVASDPNEMARQLTQKRRTQALTRPMARR